MAFSEYSKTDHKRHYRLVKSKGSRVILLGMESRVHYAPAVGSWAS